MSRAAQSWDAALQLHLRAHHIITCMSELRAKVWYVFARTSIHRLWSPLEKKKYI
jgi:hypothetical protein